MSKVAIVFWGTLGAAIIVPLIFMFITGPLFTIVCAGYATAFRVPDAMGYCLERSVYNWGRK